MMKNYKVDALDREILNLLQSNGRLSKTKIAQSVNLSTVPCWRRVRHLEKTGLISSYIALVDKEKLGFGFQAFIYVSVNLFDAALVQDFRRLISSLPEVLSFYHTTGDFDYVLYVVTRGVDEFRDFVDRHLRPLDYIKKMVTSVVLSTIKNQHTILL